MIGIEACFTGRLGRDAELKHVKGGTMPFLSFTVAVDQQHQTEDSPAQWVRVVCFGDLAETMVECLVKGTRVYCEGRLEVSLWQPDDGRPPRININMTATTVQPLGQIGRQRPRQTRNAERGQRTWDRSRDAGRLRDAQAPFYDDTAAAIAALERGRGR
jgi:single-strand DNA-binding protein